MKLIFTVLMLLSNITMAQTTILLDQKTGKTEFVAVGNPGFLKINGHGLGPKGEIKIQTENAKKTLSGDLEIDLTSLDTGMKLRNTHMKEKYLEVATYPKAKLTILNQVLASEWDIANPNIKQQKLKAQLEIHGQKKDVEVNYEISKGLQLSAEFEIKITDFKIDIPSFMGVTVADKVQVKVNSKLRH